MSIGAKAQNYKTALTASIRRYQRYLQNSSWIVAERALYIVLALASTAVLTRILGPEGYGIISFSIAIVGIFGVVSHLGLSGLVVKAFLRKENDQAEVFATVIFLKAIAALLAFLSVSAYTAIYEQGLIATTTIVVAISVLFRPWDTFDFWFQSRVEAKFSAISKAIGKVSLVVWQICAAVLGASLPIVAAGAIVSAAITALFLYLFYRARRPQQITIQHMNFPLAKSLLKGGGLIFAGTLLASINIKADQVMLKWLSTMEEVGIYSAAVVLSEAMYFLPAAIVASVFPRLIALRELDVTTYQLRLQQLLIVLAILGTGFAICATVVSVPLTRILFGPEFSGSALILSIHAWASVYIFVRAALSRWILIEDMLIFSLLTHGLGALVNVSLNLILIPAYGGVGAAIATLVSYAVASHFALLLHRKGGGMFIMVGRAILWPLNLQALRTDKGRSV